MGKSIGDRPLGRPRKRWEDEQGCNVNLIQRIIISRLKYISEQNIGSCVII
jgi:hypothetical protein